MRLAGGRMSGCRACSEAYRLECVLGDEQHFELDIASALKSGPEGAAQSQKVCNIDVLKRVKLLKFTRIDMIIEVASQVAYDLCSSWVIMLGKNPFDRRALRREP